MIGIVLVVVVVVIVLVVLECLKLTFQSSASLILCGVN